MSQKRSNVSGKFACSYDLSGKTIILFDDVYTSGSTLAEAAKVLLAAGASKVLPLTLGVVCLSTAVPLLPLNCASCGVHLKIRFRTSDGKPFWGCPNYSSTGTHTQYFNYGDGVLALRKLWNDAENSDDPDF